MLSHRYPKNELLINYYIFPLRYFYQGGGLHRIHRELRKLTFEEDRNSFLNFKSIGAKID